MWAAARQSGTPVGEWLDFSADLNPWAAEEIPAAVMEEAWAQVRHYPDPEYRRFREAAAEREGADPASILPGNGTADLIHLISRWRKGGRAGIPVPTFTEYARAVRADGGEVLTWRFPEENGFSGEGFPRVLRQMPADLVFLCNPNNPTGRIWPVEVLNECVELCEQKGILLIVDEAYLELSEDPARASLAALAGRRRSLLVLRSMTKTFGIPGLRIGYAVGHPQEIARLEAFQPPWSLNTLAAEAGIWFLKQGENRTAEWRNRLASARVEMTHALRGMPGLRPVPSEANFLLCRSDRETAVVAQALERQKILIRRCDDFDGLEPDRFFRAAVRRPRENQRLLAALKEIFSHAG